MAEPDYAALKEGTRALWSRGDYSYVARLLQPAAQALLDATAVSAGQEVLDIGAGDGNFAIAAAKEGASVVASDITPAMVERGRERAEAAGVGIDWVVADAEELPFEAARFDCAASVFGAMFAPRPELAAHELFRVVRPGNTVGMANWCPDGLSGRFFDLFEGYLPRPAGVPKPADWGVEEVVAERFEGLAATVEIERRAVRWQLDSFEELLGAFERSGPHDAAREAMGADAYAELVESFGALVEELNQADGGAVDVESDYLLVVARKRG